MHVRTFFMLPPNWFHNYMREPQIYERTTKTQRAQRKAANNVICGLSLCPLCLCGSLIYLWFSHIVVEPIRRQHEEGSNVHHVWFGYRGSRLVADFAEGASVESVNTDRTSR